MRPHRTKSFSVSTDLPFVEKVGDIAGLYLNPPDEALVLCVCAKSQIQALERAQPAVPMGLGYVEGVTQRAIRRGSFRTVRELVRRIDAFVDHSTAHSTAHSRPFAWTATADSILAKLERLLKAISGTAH